MLSHDPSRIYEISPAAIHDHKRLRQFGAVTYGLLAIIAVLGFWTILKILGAFGSDIPDLADVASIGDHVVARLVTILTIVTLGIFLFKEWRYGDLNFNMVFFLVPLLALWLFPVVATELEPDVADFDAEFMLNLCEEGAFVDGHVDTTKCHIEAPENYTVLMSNAEPHRDDAIIRAPQQGTPEYHRWYVEGRGDFYIYFLLQHASMEECENSQMAVGRDPEEPYEYDCMERDGHVWSVHKFLTSEHRTGRLVILQEMP